MIYDDKRFIQRLSDELLARARTAESDDRQMLISAGMALRYLAGLPPPSDFGDKDLNQAPPAS